MNQPELSEKLREIFQYIQFVPLILGNKIIFLLVLNLVLVILFIFIIILIILNIKDKSKIRFYDKYIFFLQLATQLICYTFFSQIFGLLITIFMCDFSNKYSIIDFSLKCRSGVWFYVDGTLCILCIILLIYYSFTTILVFYKPNFILDESDILKKSNSIPDIIFFINKIIFIISIHFVKNNESWQWFLLIIFFLSTLLNYISLIYYNCYENIILMKLNKSLSLILFWSICSLIIGKIFQIWDFNGTVHLFLFGTILIILFFIYQKNKIY